jgi:hypothetical protein
VTFIHDGQEWRSPWPGPRPFEEGDDGLLYGRDDDIWDIIDAVDSQMPIIEISAETGMGKTSLIQAGLLPTLRSERDVKLVVSRTWSGKVAKGEELFCRSIWRDAKLDDLRAQWADGAEIGRDAVRTTLRHLQAEGDVVLVFDQFEELLRRDRQLGEEMLRVIGDVASEFDVTQIISLRSEFKHLLKSLERRLGGEKSIRHKEVKEPVDLDALIRQPPAALSPPLLVTDGAANVLKRWWKRARDMQYGGRSGEGQEDRLGIERLGGSEVGLLHLQGLLWSVFNYYVTVAGHPESGITEDLLREYKAWMEDQRGHLGVTTARSEAMLIADCLFNYVASAFVGDSEGTSQETQREAVHAASLVAPHMSSGGYKLSRQDGELAWLALKEGMETLGVDQDQLRWALGEMIDRSTSDDGGLDHEALKRSIKSVARKLVVDDASDRTTGRLRGESCAVGATTLIASFLRAVDHLKDQKVIREPPVVGSGRFYELVHDGFGPAVVAWGEFERTKVRHAAEALTASRGVDIRHTVISSAETSLGRDAISGAGWWTCLIAPPRGMERTLIEGVRFEACNLRGTLFQNCDLVRVVFDDECDLPGVMFDNCTFDDVTINGGTDTRLDGLYIAGGALHGRGLRFADLAGVAGVTLVGLQGTALAISGSNVSHLAVQPGGSIDSVSIVESRISRSVFSFSGPFEMSAIGSTFRFSEFFTDGVIEGERSQMQHCQWAEGISLAGSWELLPTPL